MTDQIQTPHPKFPILSIALLTLLLVAAYVLAATLNSVLPKKLIPGSVTPGEMSFKKFATNEEFTNYINSQADSYGLMPFGGVGIANRALDIGAPVAFEKSTGLSAQLDLAPQSASRVSDTNIQVQGVDEPDIVKTNGQEIYFSTNFGPYYPVMFERSVTSDESILPVTDFKAPNTKIINALPVEKIVQTGEIDTNGEMLLWEDTLVVFQGNRVEGYDISNPNDPKEKWDLSLADNTQLVTSRLTGNKIYLVTQTYSYNVECPMPLISGINGTRVACTDIYYPGVQTNSDSVFTIMSLNPATGEVINKSSYVGSSGQTVVYVSDSNAYLTVYRTENQTKFMKDFLANEGSTIFPADIQSKVLATLALDISDQAKLVEIQVIFQGYLNTLTSDARTKLQNDLANKLSDYTSKHARELETTSVVKLDLASLSIQATGEIPGQVLNQFSIDEWNGSLRIATTIAASQFGQGESVNDVYILNTSLETVGKILDMGRGERVYSARFIGDKGYVVTFRQTDPFYVLDLSSPNNPKITGELKIPGFSSYLHPLSDNLILGVGREGQNVKLSLFDVSNPQSPVEAAKYTLNEYWTDVQNNHHAFLADTKHSAFFMPAGQKGFIFSYNRSSITLSRAVDEINAQRALYINDNLYVLGSEKMVVINENTWENVTELAFR